MNDYTPDKWVILEIYSKQDGTYRKILSSWYGGYIGQDEWRLSSTISNQSETENSFQFLVESGSIYSCNKKAYGLSLLSTSILNKMIDQCEKINTLIKVIDFTELEKEIK